VLGGDHQRRLSDLGIGQISRELPVAVEVAVPIQPAAEAGTFEGADEHLELTIAEEVAVRRIRQLVEHAAPGATPHARRTALRCRQRLSRELLIEAA
jgi:hypothetical protein